MSPLPDLADIEAAHRELLRRPPLFGWRKSHVDGVWCSVCGSEQWRFWRGVWACGRCYPVWPPVDYSVR